MSDSEELRTCLFVHHYEMGFLLYKMTWTLKFFTNETTVQSPTFLGFYFYVKTFDFIC